MCSAWKLKCPSIPHSSLPSKVVEYVTFTSPIPHHPQSKTNVYFQATLRELTTTNRSPPEKQRCSMRGIVYNIFSSPWGIRIPNPNQSFWFTTFRGKLLLWQTTPTCSLPSPVLFVGGTRDWTRVLVLETGDGPTELNPRPPNSFIIYQSKDKDIFFFFFGIPGIEPGTLSLRSRHRTTELNSQPKQRYLNAFPHPQISLWQSTKTKERLLAKKDLPMSGDLI